MPLKLNFSTFNSCGDTWRRRTLAEVEACGGIGKFSKLPFVLKVVLNASEQ